MHGLCLTTMDLAAGPTSFQAHFVSRLCYIHIFLHCHDTECGWLGSALSGNCAYTYAGRLFSDSQRSVDDTSAQCSKDANESVGAKLLFARLHDSFGDSVLHLLNPVWHLRAPTTVKGSCLRPQTAARHIGDSVRDLDS